MGQVATNERDADGITLLDDAVRGPLFTDMYQLSMAQVYVEAGLADRTARFDHTFRSAPDYGTHQAGFCITAGLGTFLDWLHRLRFDDTHLDQLAAMRGPTGEAVVRTPLLDWLASPERFADIEISAVPEGRVVHANEPIVTVTGRLAEAQLLETALLNHLNYATAIATKASRIVSTARGGSVLEFGMRRGPGAGVADGVRAALIGGCTSTSNVQAALRWGRRPVGTHAHSLVQAYLALGLGEREAFRAVARAAPDQCVLLVDTIDTLRSGVPNAIAVFDELRAAGHTPVGVRLDSGDLADLAVHAAIRLDEAGHRDASIVLSSDLDELTIWQILTQIDDEAQRIGVDPEPIRRRLVYGVGTRLITSHGSGALNGVYKLTAIHDAGGRWRPAIKISEDPMKVPIPGPNRVWRLHDRRGLAVVDLVASADEDPLPDDEIRVHHPFRQGVHQTIRREDIVDVEPLHHVVHGPGVDRRMTDVSIDELADRCRADLARLDTGVRRLVNPHRYHVSLTEALHTLRNRLVDEARAGARAVAPGPPVGHTRPNGAR